MKSWLIGDIKVTAIVELKNAGDVIQSSIPNASIDNVRRISWLNPNFANPDGTLNAHTQSFLIESNNLKILVDTCVGNDKKRVDIKQWSSLNTEYLDNLHHAGCDKKDITHVICTHLHFDHVGFNTSLENGKWVPTFPNAKYIFSKKEFEYWSKMPMSEIEDDRQGIIDSVLPIVRNNQQLLVKDDFILSEEISFIPTPGHTPNHVSILIKSRGDSALITGDFIHHPCQIEHTDWYTLADTDRKIATKTRKNILQEYSDTDTLVLGSHFSYPIAGHVKKNGNSYIFLT